MLCRQSLLTSAGDQGKLLKALQWENNLALLALSAVLLGTGMGTGKATELRGVMSVCIGNAWFLSYSLPLLQSLQYIQDFPRRNSNAGTSSPNPYKLSRLRREQDGFKKVPRAQSLVSRGACAGTYLSNTDRPCVTGHRRSLPGKAKGAEWMERWALSLGLLRRTANSGCCGSVPRGNICA